MKSKHWLVGGGAGMGGGINGRPTKRPKIEEEDENFDHIDDNMK